MSRKFIAVVLAATLAITTYSAAPARAASEEDIARLLAGAATLFIIGKAIQSSRDNDRKKVKVHRQSREVYQQPRARHQNQFRDQRPHRRAGLPAACLTRVDTRRGTLRVFGKRCLDRNYQSARPLPQQCLRRFETRHAPRLAYTAGCLRDNGYRLAGR